jgi:hypothetical protein
LARQAFHTQTLESSFIQCWTIWEHLFAIHNQQWLSKERIRDLRSVEKIAFLLTEYGFCNEINDGSRKRIQELASIRNRIIHFGRFPEAGNGHDDAIFFIDLTEMVIAKILGLLPSNIFNTIENLEQFLRNQKIKPRGEW